MAAWSPLLAAPAASAPAVPGRWPEIWEGNPEVADPHLIYPGDRLPLDSSRPGRPRVRHATAAASSGMRVVKLSPRVRVTKLDAAVPTIPIDAIEPFLSRSWVADARALEEAPAVLGFPDERLLAASGDRLFVRQIDEARAVEYAILRPGEALRDPVSQDVLGYLAHFVAEARLERIGDPAILRVTNAIMPVRGGDRVRPLRSDAVATRPFLPRPAPAGLKGHIISVLDDFTYIGQYHRVVLDRGARDGVEIGQVFAVHDGGHARPGPDASLSLQRTRLPREAGRDRDVSLVPDAQVGIILVFRVFERVSLALVMRAQQALRVGQGIAAPHESMASPAGTRRGNPVPMSDTE